MGRKGVSKRKRPQAKAGALSQDNSSVSAALVRRSAGSQLVKPAETDKTIVPTDRGSTKHSSETRKNSRKR